MWADDSSDDDDSLFLKDILTNEMVPIQEMEAPTDIWGESLSRAVVSPETDKLADVAISDLKQGDIVFVSEFSLVSIGQLLVRFITGDLFSSGGSDAVHCFVVIDSDRSHAGVAHVTNSGACINLISRALGPAQAKSGRVYRLLADRDGAVGVATAKEATDLVDAQVSFGTTKSLFSAFRDPKAGFFIHNRFRSRRRSIQMWEPGLYNRTKKNYFNNRFCTEFVMTTIQNAVNKMNRLDDPALIRATDIDGSACTPMQLEAFFRDNIMTHGDWCELGACSFQYS